MYKKIKQIPYVHITNWWNAKTKKWQDRPDKIIDNCYMTIYTKEDEYAKFVFNGKDPFWDDVIKACK